MQKLLRRMACAFLLLLLIAIFFYAWSRATPVPQRLLDAVAQLENSPTPQGKNGRALLLTLTYDVPEYKAQQAAESLLDRSQQLTRKLLQESQGLDFGKDQEQLQTLWSTHAARRQNDATLHALAPLHTTRLCKSNCPNPVKADYLQQVSALAAEWQPWVQAHRQLLAKVDAMARTDHFTEDDWHNRFPGETAQLYLPAVHALADASLASAVRFVQGDAAGAVQSSCRQLLTGQRMVQSDSLVLSMIGIQHAATAMQSLAHFWSGDSAAAQAALAASQTLPECQTAIKAYAEPLTLCRAMAGEWRYTSVQLDQSWADAISADWLERLFFDAEKTRALMAGPMQWHCTEAAAQAARADQLATGAQKPPNLTDYFPLFSLECMANFMGCSVAGLSAPAYSSYALRLQDATAMQHALQSLHWLHTQPQTPALLARNDIPQLTELLKNRPYSPQTTHRPIQIAQTEQESLVLQVALIDRGNTQRYGTFWRLPLSSR